MATIEHFSTVHVEPGNQEFWSRVDVEHESRMMVLPHPAGLFNGDLVLCEFGSLSVAQVTTGPVRGQSWDVALHDSEHAFLHLLDAGALELVQDDKRIHLDAGALTVLLGARPYSVAFGEGTCLLLVKLPLHRLTARIGDPERWIGTRTEARDTALLSGFLRTIIAQETAEHEPAWDDAVSDVVLDLVALAFRRPPSPAAPRSTVGERWQRTVREFVDRHLPDPELGASMIAQRLGVTPRYVQMVFAGMDTTASAYIVDRRLELAAQLLADGSARVTDVAFRAGFADLSYFYRSFRKRYGISPKRYATR
jgi:AraC-like DNA-binding protein